MPSFVMLRTADRRKSCGVSPVYVPYRPFFLALSPVLSSLPNPARTQAFCHALRKQPTGKITPIRRLSRSEEHTSELQSQSNLVCRLLLEKKKKKTTKAITLYKYNPTTFRRQMMTTR